MSGFDLVSPCTIGDLAEVLGPVTSAQLGMFRGQIAAGNSFAGRNGLGEAVVCGGYLPVEGSDRGHCWFVVHPERGALMMGRVLRTIALTMAMQPYAGLQVEAGTDAGRRIAAALGFEPPQQDTAQETWLWLPSKTSSTRKTHQRWHGPKLPPTSAAPLPR